MGHRILFLPIAISILVIVPAMSGGFSNESTVRDNIVLEPNRFASVVIELHFGDDHHPGYADPSKALGGPRGLGDTMGSVHVLSLGKNGYITLGFDVTIANGPGKDFIVFENPFYINAQQDKVFAELMYVEVSTDGTHFARFPSISNTSNPGSSIDPYDITNLAGVWPVYANVDENNIDPFDPAVAGGDAFDLEDLTNDPLVLSGDVDLQNINYIKLIDILGDGSCFDSQGNPIYDPTGYLDNGADVDAISVINYRVSIDEWTGNIRVEGKSDTIWNGEITVVTSTINAKNISTGQIEIYFIPYPSVLGALDEASKAGGFSYEVEYWPSFEAFYVYSIGDDVDWWHYWVDYDLPMVGCGKYELTENDDEILWGFLVTYPPDYDAHALRISIDKYEVKKNEEFTVSVYNETMSPVEGATVYVDSQTYTTDENGNVTISLSENGAYSIYAEKQGHVRSEKITINVKSKPIVTITKPEQRGLYFMNRKLRIKPFRTIIIGAIDVEVQVATDVEKVEFYIDNNLKCVDTEPPFTWKWDERAFFKKTIKVTAYANNENCHSDEREVIIFQL